MRPILTIIVIVAIIFPLSARAFDGDEHRHISRTGLKLAMEYFASRGNCALTSDQAIQLAAFADPHSNLEYGTLVSSVDYRLNPLQLLQKYSDQGDQTDLASGSGDLDPQLMRLLTSGGSTFFRAATANDTHFQGELITGLRNWHAYAVSVAAGSGPVRSGEESRDTVRVGGNLFAALLINSIADHFLQDFFAPGHIITPRFGLHDAAALSMHNKYNTLGAWFSIERKDFDEDLRPLLEFLALGSLSHERFAEGADQLRKDDYVPLWGDSQLKESKTQELLMILVEARSILDILESAASCRETDGRVRSGPVNRFLNVGWNPMKQGLDKKGRKTYEFATASLPYGKYVHHNYHGGPPKASAVLSFSMGGEMLLGIDGKKRGQEKRTTARTVYALELLVAGRPPISAGTNATDVTQKVPVHFDVYRQWGLSVGYVFAHNATETATGVMGRAIYALPLMHAQLSADVSEKEYSYKDDRKRRTAYGVRIQSGLSLLLFDLGVSREWTYGLRGLLKPEVSIRFGASIIGPSSSIPWVQGLERRFFRGRRNCLEAEDRKVPLPGCAATTP